MFVAAWAEGGQEGSFGLALLSVATVLATVVGACHWRHSPANLAARRHGGTIWRHGGTTWRHGGTIWRHAGTD